MHLRFGIAGYLCVLIAVPVTARSQATTRPDTIRGRVRDSLSGAQLSGVIVTATRAPDRAFVSDTTDPTGYFAIVWPNGTGDYLVHFAAPGWNTKRVRLQGRDSALVMEVALAPVATTARLNTITVKATRPVPRRDPPHNALPGSNEHTTDGVTAALSPADASSVASMATLTPGIVSQGNGFSALGLASGQNVVRLNGMTFTGSSIPRDIPVETRITTSTFDPSVGWFSGAEAGLRLSKGGIIASRSSHLTLTGPQFAGNCACAAGNLGMQAGMASRGPLGDGDIWFYNGGAQVSRSRLSTLSITSMSPDALAALGVSRDAAARFLGDVRSFVPAALDVDAANLYSTGGTFLLRLDRAPYNRRTFQPAKTAFSLTTFGEVSSQPAGVFHPLATGYVGEIERQAGGAQLEYSTYAHRNYLFQAQTALSLNHVVEQPALVLPHGTVTVASELAAGPSASNLAFGGDAEFGARSLLGIWETGANLQFYPARHPRHRLMFAADLRSDFQHVRENANQLGTFSYASLADLESNRPSAFERTLVPRTDEGTVLNSFLSASDYWTAKPGLELMYGLRAEAFRALSPAPRNSQVESLFGVRQDIDATRLRVSPRLGFTWVRRSRDIEAITNGFGSFGYGPASAISGGIGEFRSALPVSLLSDLARYSGLANAQRRIECVGAGVPSAAWSAFEQDTSNIPRSCATTTPSVGESSPDVLLATRSHDVPTSWRGNLAYSGGTFWLSYRIEGIYSLNLNQPERRDLNLVATPRLYTAGEERPVFVSANSIVPTGGVFTLADSRIHPEFNSVWTLESGRSVSRQLSITVMPAPERVRQWTTAVSYTYLDVRARQSGFTGTAFSSPSQVTWARQDGVPAHQFRLQGGYAWSSGTAVSLYALLLSGERFTPIIGADVNGDGLVNDRAYIFAPDSRDSVIGRSMAAFMAGTGGSIRQCMVGQVQRVAAPGSCIGPWTATSNAQLRVSGSALHLGERAQLTLNLENPIGMLRQAFGSGDQDAVLALTSSPDPVLYYVTGFDPATRRYSYLVNPHFARTAIGSALFAGPSRLSIEVSLDLSRPFEVQQLDRALRPGRSGRAGPKLTFEQLRAGYTRTLQNPYKLVLAESDSLLLSGIQVDSLAYHDARLAERVDSIIAPLARELAALPDEYDARAALTLEEQTLDHAAAIVKRDVLEHLPELLTPIQRRVLPDHLARFLDPGTPISYFRGAAPF